MGLLDRLFGKGETAEGKKAPEKPATNKEGVSAPVEKVRSRVFLVAFGNADYVDPDGFEPGRCYEHSHEPGDDANGGWHRAKD